MDTIRILNLAISLTGVVLSSIGILHLLLSKKYMNARWDIYSRPMLA